ncbi:hypothetical protein HanRHA438_Chr17g0810271 [Helianthus annuus]|nr:hypothetical protein HanRHA438_Chr17g0810271 [Helianthus annuus]
MAVVILSSVSLLDHSIALRWYHFTFSCFPLLFSVNLRLNQRDVKLQVRVFDDVFFSTLVVLKEGCGDRCCN